MVEEHKQPVTIPEDGMTAAKASQDAPPEAHPGTVPDHRAESLRGQVDRKLTEVFGPLYIKDSAFNLFWVFVIGSVIGLILETLFHMLVYGGYESRAGLIWGPFSPIYGCGAVLLTLSLNRLYYSHNLVVFLVAMVVGSFIEYLTSWGMDVFWGAVAWDYSDTFGNLNGRTNFAFGIMWGLLGVFWARFILPIIKRSFEHVDTRSAITKAVTAAMAAFMLLDITVTVLALNRDAARADGIAPQNPIDQFYL